MKIVRFFILLVCLPLFCFAVEDEVFNANGEIKKRYLDYQVSLARSGKDPSKQLHLYLDEPLNDDISVLPYPLILEPTELIQITEGARLRALAYYRFFEDVVLGEARAISNDGFIDAALLDQIIAESGYENLESLRRVWAKKDSSYIHFFYGPDLIRNQNGDWVVMEDNFGRVGGLGDVFAAHRFLKTILGRALPSEYVFDHQILNELKILYQEFIDLHKAGCKEKTNLTLDQWYYFDETAIRERAKINQYKLDLEDRRTLEILEQVKGNRFAEQFLYSLDFKDLTDKQKHHDGEMISDVVLGKIKSVMNTLSYSKETDRQLKNIFSMHGVALSMAPGTSVMSHKALLVFAEKMIEFYHVEEGSRFKALRNIPTRLISKTEQADEVLNLVSKKVPYVLKKPTVDQGNGVYLLNRIEAMDRALLKLELEEIFLQAKRTESSIPLFVIQDHVEPSEILGHYIDIRPIGFSSGQGNFRFLSVPFGRAGLKEAKQGKSNISQGAKEMIVLTDKEELKKRRCELALDSPPQHKRTKFESYLDDALHIWRLFIAS